MVAAFFDYNVCFIILLLFNMLCPCQSARLYTDCCAPLHQGAPAADALALMRSRYAAYVLQQIDYIVATTLPSQQALLDIPAIQAWSAQTQWDGLTILRHQATSKRRAIVVFIAYFINSQGTRCEHYEQSHFIQLNQRWYFIDPTVAKVRT